METARVKQPVAGVSVRSIVRAIDKPGEENGEQLEKKYEGYLRTFCSNDMQKDFPDRKYSVNKVEGADTVLVSFVMKEQE